MKTESIAKRSWWLVVISAVVWSGMVGTGFTYLAQEEFTPVPTATSAGTFPANSSIPLASDRPTLLLFVHPHCPCTRATLHELDGLLATIQNQAAITIVFVIPDTVPPRWEEGDLWNTAANLPGVQLRRDQGGREATRFGVKGSGHVLLYRPSGQLLFSGGITASRGHEGDNAGRSAIVSFVLNGRAPINHTPVFGCPLL